MKQSPDRSHFEDIDEKVDVCTDREHNPPMHLQIPDGKQYVHICPSCGQRRVIRKELRYSLNQTK